MSVVQSSKIRWTDDDIAKMRGLIASGLTLDQVVYKMHLKKSVVMHYVADMPHAGNFRGRRPDETPLRCMCCGQHFMSFSARLNRLCGVCAKSA